MPDRAYPTLAQAARIWARIGLLSFGGPAGQIALMHRILVEENRWLGERRFLHALNYCMLLPGPEAMQLAVYIGWLMHRTLGGIIAGFVRGAGHGGDHGLCPDLCDLGAIPACWRVCSFGLMPRCWPSWSRR